MNKTKKFIFLVILFSLFTVNLTVFNVEAQEEAINDKTTAEEIRVIESVEKVDPQKPKRSKISRKKGKLSNEERNLKKEFNINTKTATLEKNGRKIEIGTPAEIENNNTKIQDDKIIFEASNNKVDLTLENVEGGIRQVIVINDENQPRVYNFPMKLNQGDYIVSNANGSLTVNDKENNKLLTVLKPWARDKNGKTLNTYYKVNQTGFEQVIDSEGAEFPVVADPTWCGNQIQSVWWSDDNSGGRLNVIPTWCGRYAGTNSWDAWTEVYNRTPYHWQFNWSDRRYGTNKYWSLYNQFKCHYANPLAQIFEGEWNLEVYRPHVSIWETYKAKCNP